MTPAHGGTEVNSPAWRMFAVEHKDKAVTTWLVGMWVSCPCGVWHLAHVPPSHRACNSFNNTIFLLQKLSCNHEYMITFITRILWIHMKNITMLAGGRATIQRQENSAKHTGGKLFPHFTLKRLSCQKDLLYAERWSYMISIMLFSSLIRLTFFISSLSWVK